MSWFKIPNKQRDSKDLSLASWLGNSENKSKVADLDRRQPKGALTTKRPLWAAES